MISVVYDSSKERQNIVAFVAGLVNITFVSASINID